MLVDVPRACGECPYTTYYNGIRICGFPIHTRDELMLDVTSFKAPSDYVPNWCKIPDINNTYDSLAGAEKEAYSTFVSMALAYARLNH